jgi:hypothetical protein
VPSDVFNGLGQLTREFQAHSGAVDPNNPDNTPSVRYTYSTGDNNSRLVSITYPNGRVITYNYADPTLDDPPSRLNDAISRVTSISTSAVAGIAPAGILEKDSYLGLGTVVQRDFPQAKVMLTYIRQGSCQFSEAEKEKVSGTFSSEKKRGRSLRQETWERGKGCRKQLGNLS